MGEAMQLLTLSKAGARKAAVDAKNPRLGAVGRGKECEREGRRRGGQFAAGLEWEILNADTVLTNANQGILYIGHLQCIYALNAAHSKFTALFRTVFPHGLVHPSLFTATSPSRTLHTSTSVSGLSVARLSVSGSYSPAYVSERFCLFNLVFSLLPKKVQSLVGLLGFKHDRALALRTALAVHLFLFRFYLSLHHHRVPPLSSETRSGFRASPSCLGESDWVGILPAIASGSAAPFAFRV
ncbi:hypothetical protein C8R44DRAFT_988715 [Mycena epipterygia]|nr:hypothetical protein C8R44DRAFT_988715 [Mycena epipterygia]